MFEKSIMNITGFVPLNPKKFPMLIGTGDDFAVTQVCKTPDDIPQSTDFVVLGTCIAIIEHKN